MPTPPETESVRVRVPAKINLHLGVGPLRDDGFHELRTVFHAVDLVDEVTVTPDRTLGVEVTGDDAALVPTGPENLAWRAAELLAAQLGREPHVRISLAKRIPVAGGMAGGSADAAATLLACATLWGADVDGLAALAAQLGSDVAFPLLGGTALGTGRGEVLTPAMARGRLHWVLAIADHGVSARDAYARLDELRATRRAPKPAGDAGPLLQAVRSGDPLRIGSLLANDLQPAVLTLAPDLRHTLEAGRRLGAVGCLVSGSGPTCAFLARDEARARALARNLEEAGVCRTVRTASGPVPGARVVA